MSIHNWLLEDPQFQFVHAPLSPDPDPDWYGLVHDPFNMLANDFDLDPASPNFAFKDLCGECFVHAPDPSSSGASTGEDELLHVKDAVVQRLRAARLPRAAPDVDVIHGGSQYWRRLPNGLHQVFGMVVKLQSDGSSEPWAYEIKAGGASIGVAHLAVRLTLRKLRPISP